MLSESKSVQESFFRDKISYEFLLMKWLDEAQELYVGYAKTLDGKVALAYARAIEGIYNKLVPELREQVNSILGGEPVFDLGKPLTILSNGKLCFSDEYNKLLEYYMDERRVGYSRMRLEDMALMMAANECVDRSEDLVGKVSRVERAIIDVLDTNDLLLMRDQLLRGNA